jgi:integrase
VSETVDEWYARFLALQRSRGGYGREHQWRAWVSPFIGAKPWAKVTEDDVENIRDVLDAAIEARRRLGPGRRRLTGRTAYDVWYMLRGAVRAARRSKDRSLRVLKGKPDPTECVEAPGDARTRRVRRKTFIYPTEALALLSCRRVPRAWRELYAIAGYTYLRPGELRVLRWSDVDLARRVILVTKAWHYGELREKPPKTHGGEREVPIHPSLLPLLRRMKARSNVDEPVAPILTTTSRPSLPKLLRGHLRRAGVERTALFVSSDTAIRANFRSWRDTGITWLVLSGLGVERVMRRAGHEDITTTMGYVKAVEDHQGLFGRPFPRLPRELVGRK